jgi:uncharacterized protein YhaN
VAQHRKIALICALFKVHRVEQAWKAIDHRLQKPCYLSREDHNTVIRRRMQSTDIVKYFFVNMTTVALHSLLQLLVTASTGHGSLILSNMMMMVIPSSKTVELTRATQPHIPEVYLDQVPKVFREP